MKRYRPTIRDIFLIVLLLLVFVPMATTWLVDSVFGQTGFGWLMANVIKVIVATALLFWTLRVEQWRLFRAPDPGDLSLIVVVFASIALPLLPVSWQFRPVTLDLAFHLTGNALQATWEELMLRGVALFAALSAWGTSRLDIRMAVWSAGIVSVLPWVPDLIQGASFYDTLFQMYFNLCIGVALGGLVVWTQSLWVPMLLHATLNVSLGLFTDPGWVLSDSTSNPTFDAIVRVAVFVPTLAVGHWLAGRSAERMQATASE